MSCPFCVNCQVFDSPFRFPLPLGSESHKLYYNTYSRYPSEVRQYCRNEYSFILSEKQYRENCIELDNCCAYWDIEIVTAIVKYIVHELHPSLPLGLESLKLYYDTFSRTPSEVRQFCNNEYFLKLTPQIFMSLLNLNT